ncbi:cation diffusion facilitator family transporter [Collinsella sp. AGMB00827]|uniref:Cation diffusion facilitator family transporter n=1 Tax=Collinsella ureilytica TaxID=2869515 RepID=A0ABS7MJT4_9ACTN|nr:cation diffusion facilitator family transporter [Collinsella urealyticum]MBY4797624.1 cation diffusion facilitator family transporter [Collinsella urealyticum]
MTRWLIERILGVEAASEAPAAEARTRLGQVSSLISIGLNLLLCLAKGVAGLTVGSVAIVADAMNNLSDASSNIVSLVGFKLASRPADREHPYGHGRFEYLAGLVVAVLVAAVGIELIRSSIAELIDPVPVSTSVASVLALVFSIVIKLWMAVFNRAAGLRIDSEPLIAAAVDSRNDVLATAVVLVCTGVTAATGLDLDGWAGLAVGAFILVSGFGLVRDTVNPLLGEAPSPKQVARIKERILSYPGVLGTHDLMVHDYGPGRQFASAHVEMAAESDPLATHDLIDNIEQDFLTEEGLIMTLHYDPIVTDDPGLDDLRNWLAAEVETVHPGLTVHDVRRVLGPTHTNVVFDCVRPADLLMTDRELKARLSKLVRDQYPDAVCKITVDHSYVSSQQ